MRLVSTLVLVFAILHAGVPTRAAAQSPQSPTAPTQARELAPANLGEVQFSLLDPAQFAAVNGPGWVLMDGDPLGTVQRSELCLLASVCELPDARGLFVRAMNAGRADGWSDPWVARPVGSQQADTVGTHQHGYQVRQNGGRGIPEMSGPFRNPVLRGETTTGTLGPETRPRNVALYLYVYVGTVAPEGGR
jgi:hypothetical protein